jgi:hypothetical protein
MNESQQYRLMYREGQAHARQLVLTHGGNPAAIRHAWRIMAEFTASKTSRVFFLAGARAMSEDLPSRAV